MSLLEAPRDEGPPGQKRDIFYKNAARFEDVLGDLEQRVASPP